MQNIKMKFLMLTLLLLTAYMGKAQEEGNVGTKTTTDITVNPLGNATVSFTTKYNAAYWDYFLKNIGSNTSILKNQIIKAFPKEEVSDFSYAQSADDRTNTVKFTVLGMAKIDKNGRWSAELDSKNPDITKISEKDYLLMEEGNALKIHLPEGTSDSKVEKDSFGKALLTFPATESGSGTSKILLFAGIALALFGAYLLYKKMQEPRVLRTVYEPVTHHEEIRDGQADQARGVPPVPGRVSGPSVVPDEFPADKPPVYKRDAEQ